MLSFAAIVPSSPLILRAHEDERMKSAWQHTLAGLDILAQQAKELELDYGILISQLLARDDIFGINASPGIQCDLRDYGDFHEHEYAGSPYAAQELLSACGPIAAASSEKNINGAHAVALTILAASPRIGILPLYVKRGALPQECARFGHMLSQGIQQSSKRYGVVTLGDSPHRHSTPASQYHVNGAHASQFEQEVIAALKRKAVTKLIDYAIKHEDEWRTSSLPALIILASIMGDISCQFKHYAYENLFGAGYLTAQFII